MGGLSGCTSDVRFAAGSLVSKDSTNPPVNAPTVNETYQVPKSAAKVDVLFVVDGTPRMYLTIEQLQTRMQGFFDALGGADYQAGIMNSSMGTYDAELGLFPIAGLMSLNPFPMDISGNLTIVTNNVENGDWILGRNLNFNGLSQSTNSNTSNEPFCTNQPFCAVGASEPLNAIKTFLQNPSANAGFLRPGAMFVPVIISSGDENDQGSPAQPVSVGSDVIAAFNQSQGQTSGGMRGFSIIVQPNDAACLNQYSSIFQMGSGGVYGTQLDQFAKSSGGASISICQNDYTTSLGPITQGFSSNVTSITLQQQPLDGTVKIVSVPAASLQFTVDGSTVTFSQPLPSGATLSISYQVKPQ